MRLSCLLLGCFFSFYIFAQPSKKTYKNIKEAQGHAIKAPLSMMGVDVDHSVGVSVDGEAIGERCLSPETTVGDAGSSLTLEFTDPKPLLPAGKDVVYIQNGKNVFRQSQLDQEKSFCMLGIRQKNTSSSMQLIKAPIKVANPIFANVNNSKHASAMLFEEPFNYFACFDRHGTSDMRDMTISEFKKIVGDAMRVKLTCSKLGDSKSKK